MPSSWHDVYPPEGRSLPRDLIVQVRTAETGFELRVLHRWTREVRRIVTVRQTWQVMLDWKGRSRVVSDFINDLLLKRGSDGDEPVVDPEFKEKYPRLHAFLTVTRVRVDKDNVVPRRTASISVFLSQGCPGASLNDRGQSRLLFCTADTFEGVWEALEGMLASGNPPWRYQDAFEPEKHTTTRKRKA
jgi:hypothetical protein